MQEPGQQPPVGPGVCPFVALVGNRDRRADGPDPDNRCYAEPAPRKRDQRYQADFCYSPDFASCSVFLAWAARNAAEPAGLTEAARRAWSASIAAGGAAAADGAARSDEGLDAGEGTATGAGTPEGGLFGEEPDDDAAADEDEAEGPADDGFDWVPASAWADVPYDEQAEAEAREREAAEAAAAAAAARAAAEEVEEEPLWVDLDDIEDAGADEDTIAPKVPAALPVRKRKPPLQPIRTRGSGEWIYADPPGREPLVRRRYGIAPPALLLVLGLLVAALVVFIVPTLLGGGDGLTAAVSPSPEATRRPVVTRAPVATATPVPTATPEPRVRSYRVKSGDTLTGIAQRFGVRTVHLQCLNGIRNKDVVVLGSRLQIPPEGFSCPPGWRNADR